MLVEGRSRNKQALHLPRAVDGADLLDEISNSFVRSHYDFVDPIFKLIFGMVGCMDGIMNN